MFVNALTTDYKYPLKDCENFPLHIQMEFSEKGKTFSQVFVPFMETSSNFKHFQSKNIVISNVFTKLQTVKDLVR